MIDFPAIWIWYAFLVLSGVLIFIAVCQVINAFRHGSRMPLNIMASFIFVIGVVGISITTLSLLSAVDWTTSYSIPLPSASFFRLGF